MKEKRDSLVGIERPINAGANSGMMLGLRPPQIEIHAIDTALEVVLITGLNSEFMFSETIRVLHEEGAEIVNASFTAVEDTIFHTIHSKVGNSFVSIAFVKGSSLLIQNVLSLFLALYFVGWGVSAGLRSFKNM